MEQLDDINIKKLLSGKAIDKFVKKMSNLRKKDSNFWHKYFEKCKNAKYKRFKDTKQIQISCSTCKFSRKNGICLKIYRRSKDISNIINDKYCNQWTIKFKLLKDYKKKEGL